MRPLADLKAGLAAGTFSAEGLLAGCHAAIADKAGQGAVTFTRVYDGAANTLSGPLAGIPLSVKDLFDVAGEVTTGGSKAREGQAPASADSEIVRRLKAAGASIVGKTNMTELAFGGIGINPHYGTPLNPWDRKTGRIPGGSSSGAAVSVTDGMAAAAIGSDTGGSVRIPAALCGLAGFKPTQRRVPRTGVLPLSRSLDSIGPLAPTVACCALLDSVISGAQSGVPAAVSLKGLRLAVPQNYVLDGMDDAVSAAFAEALLKLSDAGAVIEEMRLAPLDDLRDINARGGFSAPELYADMRAFLDASWDKLDPRVSARVMLGKSMTAADYIDLTRLRAGFITAMEAALAPYDGWLMPTVPVVAPAIAPLAVDDEAYRLANLAILRNPSVINMADGCAITIPCHRPGEAPVGISLAGQAMQDRRILAIGLSIEAALKAA